MRQFATGQEAALTLRPDQPVYCFRPKVLTADALAFKRLFPGKTAYAVKTNGEPMVLEALVKAGITAFDVPRPAEFAAVRRSPRRPNSSTCTRSRPSPTSGSRSNLRHPHVSARPRGRDRKAHSHRPGPRHRSLRDHAFVRLQTKGHAAYELSKKFGAAPAHAVELLQRLDRTASASASVSMSAARSRTRHL